MEAATMTATAKRGSNAHHSKINHYLKGSKSVPALAEVLSLLLSGEVIHHQHIIKAHQGQQHRLGLAIHTLRHKFGFTMIQCPRQKDHPNRYHYFIAQSDLAKAQALAEYHGFNEAISALKGGAS